MKANNLMIWCLALIALFLYSDCDNMQTHVQDFTNCKNQNLTIDRDLKELQKRWNKNDFCFVTSYIALLQDTLISDCDFMELAADITSVSGVYTCGYECERDDRLGIQWPDKSYQDRMNLRRLIADFYLGYSESCLFMRKPKDRLFRCTNIDLDKYCGFVLMPRKVYLDSLQVDFTAICESCI
jgi:hypothetical protein